MTAALEGVSGRSTPRPYFTPGKDPVPHCTGGWVGSRAVLDGRKISPHGFRSPDRSARSQSLYRLRYPAHNNKLLLHKNQKLCTMLTQILWMFHHSSKRKINSVSSVRFQYKLKWCKLRNAKSSYSSKGKWCPFDPSVTLIMWRGIFATCVRKVNVAGRLPT
jgi:hypothetical protein